MKSFLIGLLVAASQLGCNNTPGAVIVTPNSVIVVDDADAVAWEGGFLWVAAEPIDPTVTVDVTTTVAAGARTIVAAFAPSSCATATASGNVLTLQLNGCTGPFGLMNASGTVTLTFTAVQNGVQIVASSSSLTVGSANLTINATGVLTGSGTSRTLTVMTDGGGTGPSGSSVIRQGQYTITWTVGASCAAVNGTVTAGTGNVQSTSFKSFSLCATGCPASGTVTLNNPTTGTTLTTTYNGTSMVTVTSSSGQQSTVTLTCG